MQADLPNNCRIEIGVWFLASQSARKESAVKSLAQSKQVLEVVGTISLLRGSEKTSTAARVKLISKRQKRIVHVRFHLKPEFEEIVQRASPTPLRKIRRNDLP